MKNIWFIIKWPIGIFLLLFGLVALVTPFTPGAWLGFVGMEILGIMFLLPKRIREPWLQFKAKMIVKLRRMLGYPDTDL